MTVNRFREVTMGAAIALREDYDAADLRRIAKGSKDAAQSRRLLSLAEIYAGGRRTDAARIDATDLQVIRDWVLRFNALGPSGLLDRKAPGNPPKLDTAQRQALAVIVESGPIGAAVFESLKRRVVLGSEQTPQYADIRKAEHDGGDFLLVRRGAIAEKPSVSEGADPLEKLENKCAALGFTKGTEKYGDCVMKLY